MLCVCIRLSGDESYNKFCYQCLSFGLPARAWQSGKRCPGPCHVCILVTVRCCPHGRTSLSNYVDPRGPLPRRGEGGGRGGGDPGAACCSHEGTIHANYVAPFPKALCGECFGGEGQRGGRAGIAGLTHSDSHFKACCTSEVNTLRAHPKAQHMLRGAAAGIAKHIQGPTADHGVYDLILAASVCRQLLSDQQDIDNCQ
jgi:hypothetical protein